METTTDYGYDENNHIPTQAELDACKTLQEKFQLRPPEIYYTKDGKGLSKLFGDVNHPHFRFNVDQNCWMYFSQKWVVDKGDAHIRQAAKIFASELDSYVPAFGDYEFEEKQNLGKASARKSLIKDAEDVHIVEDSDFDQNPDLFNCLNGTLNVKTGEFHNHCPEDMITSIANVAYIPNADSSLLKKFLLDVFEGDEETIKYVCRILSLCLTGHTNEHCLFVFLGETSRNGKSTLLNTFGYMLGGYSVNIDISTLSQRKYFNGSAPSSDVARIKGKRFIVSSEPPQGFVFDESRTKALTGGDLITARKLHQNDIEFKPQGKIFIGTNHRPLIEDDAIIESRRIRVIPFNHHFSSEEQDISLPDKLKQPEVLSALLNYCLQGYKEYLQAGLNEPPAVVEAMSAYQTQEQIVKAYFNYDLMKTSPDDKITLAQFYPRYCNWCTSNGFAPIGKEKMNVYLRSKGLYLAHGTVKGKTYRNLLIGYRFKSKQEILSLAGPMSTGVSIISKREEGFADHDSLPSHDVLDDVPTQYIPSPEDFATYNPSWDDSAEQFPLNPEQSQDDNDNQPF